MLGQGDGCEMLRVLTYNIHGGPPGVLPAVAQVIRAQQPDAVALVEPPDATQVDALARSLDMRAVYAEQSRFPVAWLSRPPVASAQAHEYLGGAKQMLQLDITWAGQEISLFAVHLGAGRTGQYERRRAREVTELLGYLPRVSGRPHLLAGDFNALHPMDAVARPRLLGVVPYTSAAERAERLAIPLLLEAGYTDCFRAMHRGASREPGYTFALPHPRMRIDYIFASMQLARRLVACDVVTAPPAPHASDHFPVIAELV